jgi:membrane protein implicated in regulation of membrane protease activity
MMWLVASLVGTIIVAIVSYVTLWPRYRQWTTKRDEAKELRIRAAKLVGHSGTLCLPFLLPCFVFERSLCDSPN